MSRVIDRHPFFLRTCTHCGDTFYGTNATRYCTHKPCRSRASEIRRTIRSLTCT
jgi:hypothetical protein